MTSPALTHSLTGSTGSKKTSWDMAQKEKKFSNSELFKLK